MESMLLTPSSGHKDEGSMATFDNTGRDDENLKFKPKIFRKLPGFQTRKISPRYAKETKFNMTKVPKVTSESRELFSEKRDQIALRKMTESLTKTIIGHESQDLLTSRLLSTIQSKRGETREPISVQISPN